MRAWELLGPQPPCEPDAVIGSLASLRQPELAEASASQPRLEVGAHVEARSSDPKPAQAAEAAF